MKKMFVLFTLLFWCDCGEGRCYVNFFQNVANFEVRPDMKTPSGIRVDSGGYQIDLQILDERIEKMEKCVLDVMAENAAASKETLNSWGCLRWNPYESLRRHCLIIKITAPVFSKCTNWQFISTPGPFGPEPIKADPKLCEAKGLTPTEECPCLWRTLPFNDTVVVAPPPEMRNVPPTSIPAPYLYNVAAIMTSCNNIWFSPFARCLSL